MKLIYKQFKVDFSDMLSQAAKMCIVIPVMFILINLSGSPLGDAQSYIKLMTLLALPAGFITLTMTRILIALPTSITMGSTRSNFYTSNFITLFISFFICTEISIAATALVAVFINKEAAIELLKFAVLPQTILPTLCLSVFSIGIGTLMGVLMSRFGRKIWYAAIIILILLGGIIGGVIGVLAGREMTAIINPTVLNIIFLSVLALGVAFYAISHRQIKKFYIS